MDDIKVNIAKNMAALRLAAGMTQAELAKLLCYSDKSVSKWERAESAPDITVLKAIADRFSVTVDYLITEHDETAPLPAPPDDAPTTFVSKRRITAVAVLGVYAVAFLVFVILWLSGRLTGMPFAIATPTALVTALVLHSIWYGGKYNFYIVSGLMLSIFALIYFIFKSYNPWQIFLLAIPSEIIIFIAFHLKSSKIR